MGTGGSLFTRSSPRVNRLVPMQQTVAEVERIVRALASPLPRAHFETPEGTIFVDSVEQVEFLPRDERRELDDGLFRVSGELYAIVSDGVLLCQSSATELVDDANRQVEIT